MNFPCIDVTLPPVKATGPLVLVAAAALVDPDNRVLLAERPPGKSMAGLWEFPGGKLMSGETPEAALVRELEEELGIITSIGCLYPLTFASHAYPEAHLLMPLYGCRTWNGVPKGLEGQKLAWVKVADLGRYEMPPADLPLVRFLQSA